MEAPVLPLLRPATGLWLGDVMEEPRETYVEVPIFISGVLHRAHKVPEHVVAMGLILLYADATNEIAGDTLQNAELLSENERAHGLARIKYSHELVPNSFSRNMA